MLFGVLDLARDPEGFIETALAKHSRQAMCLYREPLSAGVRRRAPYLAPLPAGSAFVKFWREEGWGRGWGILFQSDMDQQTIWHHLRKFLTVELPDGQRVLFRFYDPRILPAYLRSCNTAELAMWFKVILAFRVEGPSPKEYTEFRFHGGRLVET